MSASSQAVVNDSEVRKVNIDPQQIIDVIKAVNETVKKVSEAFSGFSNEKLKEVLAKIKVGTDFLDKWLNNQNLINLLVVLVNMVNRKGFKKEELMNLLPYAMSI